MIGLIAILLTAVIIALVSINMGVIGSFTNSEKLNDDKAKSLDDFKSIKEGVVYGRAEPFRIGRTIQVWNINITDKKNNLICTSRLTLAVINKK